MMIVKKMKRGQTKRLSGKAVRFSTSLTEGDYVVHLSGADINQALSKIVLSLVVSRGNLQDMTQWVALSKKLFQTPLDPITRTCESDQAK